MKPPESGAIYQFENDRCFLIVPLTLNIIPLTFNSPYPLNQIGSLYGLKKKKKRRTWLISQSKVDLGKQNDSITKRIKQNYSLWTYGWSHCITLECLGFN